MSHSSNRLVIIDETKFNEHQDPNWKLHKSYIHFVHDLDEDYKRSLNHSQRLNSSYISALNSAKDSYALFQIYLKIASQISETVDNLQFEYQLNKSSTKRNHYHHKHTANIKCVVNIYYKTGFIQTIIPMNKSANKHKKKHIHEANQSLIHAVKQEQSAFKYSGSPIYIEHAPSESNHLQTNIKYPNRKMKANESEYDTDDDQHMDETEENEESILWRFYGEKNPDESIIWPTKMDDTFFKHRPDVVRSDNDLTTFTFVNNNAEVNNRRPPYLDNSDVEDAESNDLSINFRSNNPIPNDIFMYYFEATVAHNEIQSHSTKFKRCYFGLIPQSKLYFPPEQDDKIECSVLQDVLLNKKKQKEYVMNHSSSLKLLANVAGTMAKNEKRDLQKKQRKKQIIQHYVHKMKNKNTTGSEVNKDNETSDNDWFESVDVDDDDIKMEAKSEIEHKENDTEKEVFNEQCIQSMKEFDKLYYSLWGDETIINSSDNEENNVHSTVDPSINHISDDMYAIDILQSRLSSKFQPPQTSKDVFVTQVFDDRHITNNSICVKVHSNLLTIAKKFMYTDEHYNNIYQSSIWKDNETKKHKETHIKKDQDDENEDDEDEKERITIDGWERIDDETFCLTKPENFEKQILLNTQQKKRVSIDDDPYDDEDEEIFKRRLSALDEYNDDNNAYGMLDDGNILINGLESFGLLPPKRKSHNLDAEEDDEDEEEEDHGTERDLVYNNCIDDPQENAKCERWKDTDEKEIRRQKKARYNKQVEIVTKFKRTIRNRDTIGIGINFHLRTLFVTINGELVNDKKYNKPLLFRDIFIDEPLYIFGILKHFGNQISYNFGQRTFKFDLNRYFSREYIGWIKRNNNYISKFMRNTHRSSVINKKLLDSAILDHCINEGFKTTAERLICKIFGYENGSKLMSHLGICNDIFKSMYVRGCIKQYLHNGDILNAKEAIHKLKIKHFAQQYPLAWFHILSQQMVELLRVNRINEAQHLYQNELLAFAFVTSDEQDENEKILKKELNILAIVLMNCIHHNGFNINGMAIEYKYLFDVKRRYRLRDTIHNLIYNHMKKRENERIDCLYNASLSCESNHTLKVRMYDSQLNLLLKHLCAVYDCYKSNFSNYLENIRFV